MERLRLASGASAFGATLSRILNDTCSVPFHLSRAYCSIIMSLKIKISKMHKEALYGTLDPTTREWNDGLFTHILRKIVDDVRGESSKRHWIIFDGDVDPEWVENLNRYVRSKIILI